MHSGVVASGGLDRRRELQRVHIAWLHLRLHEAMRDAVELLDEDPENADFRLADDGLGPLGDRTVVAAYVQAGDAEELAAGMGEVPGSVEPPVGQFAEGYRCDLEPVPVGALPPP